MITLKVRLCTGIKDRGIGLIGCKSPETLMFLTRFGIHTFGLRFPIDVIVLNEKDDVVGIVESLKPCRLFFWPVRYKKILELPEGTIKEKNIRLGSKVDVRLL